LSRNPNAIHLITQSLRLEAIPDKIDWYLLSTNPSALPILEANPNKIEWSNLSQNPSALPLLEANPDKIDWFNLSQNPNAMRLIEANLDKINWSMLYRNPNAMHLLAPLDYSTMKRTFQSFCKELVEYVLNPLRIGRISSLFGLELEEYLEQVF
jgi:hypothetical protein